MGRLTNNSRVVLSVSFAFALLIESVFFIVLSQHFLNRPRTQSLSAVPIEAEIFEKPLQPEHLTEVKPTAKARAPEPVLSKRIDTGKVAPREKDVPQENQTDSAPPMAASHGPIVLYSVSPKLPAYLKDQNLKTSVLIEFTVDKDGGPVPNLLGSSGNEELDALALRSAREWKFGPAIQNGKATSARVRLRINFEVQ